jgi:hypothetical protein
MTRRDPDLELDPGWLAQRELKRQMAMRPPDPPKRPKRTGALVVAILLVAVVAAGVVALVMHERTPPAPSSPKSGSIAISIRAVGAVEVHIDGTFVGRTPLVYSARKSKKEILIEARQIGAVQQVVPDHDQEVFLAASR